MPTLRNYTVFAIARNLTAFLHLEAGLTRSETPPEFNRNPPARKDNNAPQLRKELKQARDQLQRKDQELTDLREKLDGGSAGKEKGIRSENTIWIFGHGCVGSTWLTRMMVEQGHSLWEDPRVGDLFGNLYYMRSEDVQHKSPHFILGGQKETWLDPLRSFVLEAASSNFPCLKDSDILLVKEIHGAIGAPLLMEALPESSMILLVRDPRDIVASNMDATREEGWAYERSDEKAREEMSSAVTQPDGYVHSVASNYLRDVEKAKQAYDAHQGPKVWIRYEDLLADTLGTMRRIYSALNLTVDEEKLAQAVEKHSWKNIPEDQKGEGKFYRRGTSGGWLEDLTAEQAKIVDRVTAPVLNEFYFPYEEVEAKSPFVFRVRQDRDVFQHVYVGNEYRLPDTLQKDDIVVDVGAHIGSFCYAALQRGSHNVHGFEVEKENYTCTVRNLRHFGDRVRLHNKAVWRSDRSGDRLYLTPSLKKNETAGSNVIFATGGEEVEVVAFDDVIREVTGNGAKRVKILKLDCEGSEFPILLTSRSLHLIDSICGEYHEFGGERDPHSIPESARVTGFEQFTIARLIEVLQRAGFSAESVQDEHFVHLGRFFAKRVSRGMS